MINGYDIKSINKEQVLYIYLAFDSEFAKIDTKNSKDIKKRIKKYIKENNIDFKGSLVALMVGGAMVGTFVLNNPSKKLENNIINPSRIVAIIDENNSFANNLNGAINEEEVINENKSKEIIEEKKESKEKNNIVNSNGNSKKNTMSNVSNETSSKDKVSANGGNVSSSNNTVKEEVDNNIYVNVYRKNGSVLKLELEEYIIGVVGAEMPASFNKEALKAQAVLARTYAIKSINSNKKLTDDSSTQNYKTNSELMSVWGSSYNFYYNKIKDAVNETKGLIVVYNNETIDAVYHSTSNGRTEDSKYVWGNSVPYLKSVSSEYDTTNKSFSKTVFYSYETISNKLNNIVDSNTDFSILNRNESGRVIDILINGITYSGVNFRNIIGLRSTDFDIEKTNQGVNIKTKGYGHGVGMSQYGANGMANNGMNFENILYHYYTGVNIKNIY